MPTTRVHVCEGRENDFHQLHTSWLTLLWFFAVIRGLDVPGRKLIPNRTPRQQISPMAYFVANSVADLRFTLNRHPLA